tara:strand:- start:254 stop:1381 length:1128 start_codon:yes stop_codon:yes gene_type:complete
MIKKIDKFKLSELRKRLLKKGFKITKVNDRNLFGNLKSVYLTFFYSLFLIGFFYFLPSASFYLAKNFEKPKEIENSSKLDFEKTISGILIDPKIDIDLNYKNLFDDIFQLNDTPNNAVRLSASTLNELFNDLNYDLKDIRSNKKVKPIEISLLPIELKNIESTKKRKDLFIKIIIPLILEENTRIRLDRKRLFAILNKNNNSDSEKKWLKRKFKQYGVTKNDLSTLKIRMDVIPVSLAIAQAAKETGWGTSRFATEGNALYGQWTYTGDGIKPSAADNNSSHKVMRFKVLKASVRAYQRNLNTHSGYREFRRQRAIQRDNEEDLDSLKLVEFLDKYAETGSEYTKVLKQIIKQNSLKDFDDASILPKSNKLKNLI